MLVARRPATIGDAVHLLLICLTHTSPARQNAVVPNEDPALEILKRVQADASECRRRVESMETRFSAHDDFLRGILTAISGVQSELSQLNARADRIERRLDLVDA